MYMCFPVSVLRQLYVWFIDVAGCGIHGLMAIKLLLAR